jgi:hypothetical protein
MTLLFYTSLHSWNDKFTPGQPVVFIAMGVSGTFFLLELAWKWDSPYLNFPHSWDDIQLLFRIDLMNIFLSCF